MSKSKKVKMDMTPYNNYMSYLKNYDTTAVDNTIRDMETEALGLANSLGNRPDYVYSVDGSDAARQRAEQATYQSVVDKLSPQFANQTSDLQSRLVNQGLTPGTEAYQRAMTDLQNNQNDTLSQAAFSAVNQGQQSFSQSLADAISSGNYQNTARNLPLQEIAALLANSQSGADIQQQLFAVGSGKSDLKYQQDKANAKGGLGRALAGGLTGALNGFVATGNPYGALAGGALGAYGGYNSNPYKK